jgi:hypothetical protein
LCKCCHHEKIYVCHSFLSFTLCCVFLIFWCRHYFWFVRHTFYLLFLVLLLYDIMVAMRFLKSTLSLVCLLIEILCLLLCMTTNLWIYLWLGERLLQNKLFVRKKKTLASAFSWHNYLANDLEHPQKADAKVSVCRADVKWRFITHQYYMCSVQ